MSDKKSKVMVPKQVMCWGNPLNRFAWNWGGPWDAGLSARKPGQSWQTGVVGLAQDEQKFGRCVGEENQDIQLDDNNMLILRDGQKIEMGTPTSSTESRRNLQVEGF